MHAFSRIAKSALERDSISTVDEKTRKGKATIIKLLGFPCFA